jgi:hypothetical protein
MFRRPAVLLALMLSSLTALASSPNRVAAQTDTTRRADSTRARQPQDSLRRTQAESRGEVDPALGVGGFNLDLPNYGLTAQQGVELQQALARVGCYDGPRDGAMGQRTLRGLQCFRAQQPLTVAEVESMLLALNVSFAKPPTVVEQPAPVRRDPPPLPPVIRPDTTYRPDFRARRDSVASRDTTARRDTTVRRPPRL